MLSPKLDEFIKKYALSQGNPTEDDYVCVCYDPKTQQLIFIQQTWLKPEETHEGVVVLDTYMQCKMAINEWADELPERLVQLPWPSWCYTEDRQPDTRESTYCFLSEVGGFKAEIDAALDALYDF